MSHWVRGTPIGISTTSECDSRKTLIDRFCFGQVLVGTHAIAATAHVDHCGAVREAVAPSVRLSTWSWHGTLGMPSAPHRATGKHRPAPARRWLCCLGSDQSRTPHRGRSGFHGSRRRGRQCIEPGARSWSAACGRLPNVAPEEGTDLHVEARHGVRCDFRTERDWIGEDRARLQA